MKKKNSIESVPKFTKKIDELNSIIDGDKKIDVDIWQGDLDSFMRRLSIPELDKFTSDVMALINDIDNSAKEQSVASIRGQVVSTAEKYALVFQYFHAVFPPSQSVDKYIKDYNKVAPDGDMTIEGCNSLLFDYGMAALPDVIRAGYRSSDPKVSDLLQRNLRSIWNQTSYEICCVRDNMAKPVFESINLSILKKALLPTGMPLPECITTAKEIDMQEMIESDIQMLRESYAGEELVAKLQQYNEKQLDVSGAYQIMMNLYQEGAYSVESYTWIKDKFESIGDRCVRENDYLVMCEAAYRATGKRPKYIDNTYDFGESQPAEKKDDKKDDWINPPSKDDDLPEPTKPSKSLRDVDDDDDDKGSKKGKGNIYNITYNNSFNKKSRQRNIHGSYNNSRIDSDNISGGDDVKHMSKEEKLTKWHGRRQDQLKITKANANKQALDDTPDDVTKDYLTALPWKKDHADVSFINVAPWVIMKDSQEFQPKQRIQYRKYLAKKIIDLADDRDIEYDGKIIVAGDPVDGIYEIEITRYNEDSVLDALRKCANAVVQAELEAIKPKRSTGSKTLNEALDLFDEMKSLSEKVEGGDPLVDRDLKDRIQNKFHDVNVKAQSGLQKVDSALRDTAGTIDLAKQTPVQLVRTIKNFVSDMGDRKQQEIKEDLLKDKKTKRFILDMMSSLIKTALPWVIAGPLWGTLFNMVALPVRGFKGVHNMVRGGPHWKYKIELREELRTEIQIIDRSIENAKADNDRKEEKRLMRMKNAMVQEYVKFAGGIRYDPSYRHIERSKVSD